MPGPIQSLRLVLGRGSYFSALDFFPLTRGVHRAGERMRAWCARRACNLFPSFGTAEISPKEFSRKQQIDTYYTCIIFIYAPHSKYPDDLICTRKRLSRQFEYNEKKGQTIRALEHVF